MTDLATALANHHLTPFEGDEVIAAGIEIPGAAGGLREAMQVEPIEIHKGDEVYVVLRCSLSKVRHDPIKDTKAWRRVHILETVEAAIVDPAVVKDYLATQTARIKAAKDALEGKQRLVGHDGDDSQVNPAAAPPPADGWSDDELAVMERQHSAGAHDELRDGCPQCEAEKQALAEEAAEAAPDAPVPIDRGRNKAAKKEGK